MPPTTVVAVPAPERAPVLLLDEDVADRDRLKLGSEVESIWVGSRHTTEADMEEVAVDGDAAVVGLAGVLAHVVAELGQHVVGGLDVLRARDRLDCIDPVEQAVRRRQAICVGQLY